MNLVSIETFSKREKTGNKDFWFPYVVETYSVLGLFKVNKMYRLVFDLNQNKFIKVNKDKKIYYCLSLKESKKCCNKYIKQVIENEEEDLFISINKAYI